MAEDLLERKKREKYLKDQLEVRKALQDVDTPEIREMKRLFKQFDVDGDGLISREDLRLAIAKYGYSATEDDLKKIMRTADLDDNNVIDLEEFIVFMRATEWKLQLGAPGRDRYIHLNVRVPESGGILAAMKILLAGGIAGAVSRTCVSPFERIKILFQTQGYPPRYTSVTQAFRVIFQEEGLYGYFKGNGANCLRIFPNSALQFFSYETYKKFVIEHWMKPRGKKDLTPTLRLVVGGCAGITALTATYPLEFIRARLTVQTTRIYRGIIHGLVEVTRNEGFFALYRGLWPSICGVVPYVGIDFCVYETLKSYVPKKADGTVSWYTTLGMGAIAGTAGQTVAYPLDLVRRKLQVQGFAGSFDKTSHYNGMIDAFRGIWKKEGIRGFYRGLWPNYLKVVPSIAITFLVYEQLKRLFKI